MRIFPGRGELGAHLDCPTCHGTGQMDRETPGMFYWYCGCKRHTWCKCIPFYIRWLCRLDLFLHPVS